MTSTLGVKRRLLGAQEPRISLIPDTVLSGPGDEAIDLAAMAGLYLDPWQEFVLRMMLQEAVNPDFGVDHRPELVWAAFIVGLCVPRQNGKDAILEARELAGLFLLGEELIIHSAHEFATSAEHFRRLAHRVENTPEFARRLKGGSRGIKRSHGEEGIELIGGQRIRFKTRTKGAGLGFSCDLLIWNEAMHLAEMAVAATLPTVSARRNAQVILAGSSVDKERHEHGVAFARMRERALAALRGDSDDDDSFAYVEWSVDADLADAPLVADDRAAWAQANPGLGIRLTESHTVRERAAMDPRTFAVERLGIGDWPATDGTGEQVIDPYVWATLEDTSSVVQDPVRFAVDVSPDRSMAAICAAGERADGLVHIEVVEHRRGTHWVADRVAELVEKHDAREVIVDDAGPAGSLIPDLKERGVKVKTVTAREHAQACGMFFDAVDSRELRHLGTPDMLAAVRAAVKRPLGEAWAWSRKSSTVDISPLVACTLAHWGAQTRSRGDVPMAAWA